MAMPVGFHLIFAVLGVALPLLMVIAEALWLKTVLLILVEWLLYLFSSCLNRDPRTKSRIPAAVGALSLVIVGRMVSS